MPDVMWENARTSYDDAHEVQGDGVGDVVGVATFAADQDWHGVPTGERDCLPVRVYIMDGDGCMGLGEGEGVSAYLDLDAARELRDALDAAIVQVEMSRDRRRRSPREVVR